MNSKKHFIFSFLTFLFTGAPLGINPSRLYSSCKPLLCATPCRLLLATRLRCALLGALLIIACDYDTTDDSGTGNYQRFDWNIQGTWTTNDPESRYSGTLVITYNRITITGYGETQTPALGNDTERPFRNFTKGIALEGYTEEVEETGEKIILIKDAGKWQEGIPYTYWYTNPPPDFKKVEFLRFTFGGRQETLWKQ